MRYFGFNTLLVLFVFISLATCAEPEDQARKYLSVKYDEFEDQTNGERKIYGLAYDKSAELKPLNIAELMEFVPNTKFFQTSLDTPHFEYPRVKIIVSVKTKDEKTDIRSHVSPDFTKASGKFLAQFNDISALTVNERRLLSTGISKLLASLATDSSVRDIRVSNNLVSLRIWQSDTPWRDVYVVFNDLSKVDHISIR